MQQSDTANGPVAQMNWGLLKFDPGDRRLEEFEDNLGKIYALAESSPGFIWRVPEEKIAEDLTAGGFDRRTSATVSVWQTYDDLHCYTFQSAHGQFVDRRREWFERVEGPQLVIWNVAAGDRPGFAEALRRLDHLKTHGATPHAFGWIDQED